MSIFLSRTTRAALGYRPVLRAITAIPSKHSFSENDKHLLCHPPSPLLACQSRNFSITNAIVNIYGTISASAPVGFLQDAVIQLHDTTGLPWWATIVLSTVLFRTIVTLPLAIYQAKIVARLEMIKLEFPAIIEELKHEARCAMRMYNLDEKQMRVLYNQSAKDQWDKLVVRENCHPFKSVIVIFGQIPLWICQSVAIRNLINMFPDPTSVDAQMIRMGLSVEGFGWISDLTLVDSTFILPVTLTLLNLINIEVQQLSRPKQMQGKMARYFMWGIRGVMLLMVPIAASVPACLPLYWTTSSAVALAQNLLLVSPRFKRITGIPTNTANHLEQPYEYMAATITQRFHTARDKLFSSKK